MLALVACPKKTLAMVAHQAYKWRINKGPTIKPTEYPSHNKPSKRRKIDGTHPVKGTDWNRRAHVRSAGDAFTCGGNAFVFNTGNPDGLMATATRPESPGKFEIETGDDFALTQETLITGAAFTGLIPSGASTSNISNVVVEIYRVFPADSNVGRTSGPPTFSTPNVPTRVNSPSDVEVTDRQFSNGSLSFIPIVLQPTFTANNSVQPGGISDALY